MKIFSLQSKWSIIAWGVFFGIIADYLAFQFTVGGIYCVQVIGMGPCPLARAGWPFNYFIYSQKDYLNIYNVVFWILVSIIALSLIKYFKNRN